jgi:hypothetical protein
LGSINLEGIAKKKDDPFELAVSDQAAAKYNQLYSMRKRQLDKSDKTKEDYEFERHGQECTFAPKIVSKTPQYIRDKL